MIKQRQQQQQVVEILCLCRPSPTYKIYSLLARALIDDKLIRVQANLWLAKGLTFLPSLFFLSYNRKYSRTH